VHQETDTNSNHGIGGLRVPYGRTFIQPPHHRFEQFQVFFLQRENVGSGAKIQSLCELLPERGFVPADPGAQDLARVACRGRYWTRTEIYHEYSLSAVPVTSLVFFDIFPRCGEKFS
jgi:hypothetical protein